MSDPFIGQIGLFTWQYAPINWAQCDGSLLPISQFQALYSVIGTKYGGNGTTNFALPDLRGRVPIHPGANGVVLGQYGGSDVVALSEGQMPAHAHGAMGTIAPATLADPAGHAWATQPFAAYTTSANATMSPNAIARAGASQAHSNMQPSLALNFCIAIDGGLYPPHG